MSHPRDNRTFWQSVIGQVRREGAKTLPYAAVAALAAFLGIDHPVVVLAFALAVFSRKIGERAAYIVAGAFVALAAVLGLFGLHFGVHEAALLAFEAFCIAWGRSAMERSALQKS